MITLKLSTNESKAWLHLFRRMEEFGVEVVRVPTGYWNWLSLTEVTPNAPAEVAERFRNLQIVESWRYEKYIDRQSGALSGSGNLVKAPHDIIHITGGIIILLTQAPIIDPFPAWKPPILIP